jgi:hypothetical protein
MARIEDRGQTHTRLQWLYHDSVHFVIDNVSDLTEIDWVDDLIVSVLLVSIEILSLTTMTYETLALLSLQECEQALTGIVEKERIIWSSILY